MKTQNRLKAIRTQRGITAAELARRVGVSRQTIYAMEAGSYVPNTTTALQLARELETTVEGMFQLGEQDRSVAKPVPVEMLGPRSDQSSLGQPVRLCRVADQMFAVPSTVQMVHLPSADGIALRGRLRKHTAVDVFPDVGSLDRRVLIAGCDPGISLLGEQLQSVCDIEMVAASCSSRQALEWLKSGKVHVAGSHLRDSRTDEYNLPVVQRLFPRGGYRIVTFAMWEQGLVVRAGNPKSIRAAADLVRKDVTIVNREQGAGSRELLDKLLKDLGSPAKGIRGYGREATGHLPAAFAVSRGEADCCIATRSAAKAFALHFIPLATERFDLITLDQYVELPGVKGMFDVLNRASLRRKLELLAGYDTKHTGELLS